MRVSDVRHDDFSQRNEYSYDSVYRVIQSQYDLGGTGGSQRDQSAQTYSFDGVGNRRSVQIQSQTQGPVTEEYSVNEFFKLHAGERMEMRSHSNKGTRRK